MSIITFDGYASANAIPTPVAGKFNLGFVAGEGLYQKNSEGIVVGGVEVWATSESYQFLSINRDSDGVVTTAIVEWPDGSSGTFTTVTKNTTWLAVDAYTISHTDSSKTVTQTAVTRDANGNITAKPALTVA